MFSEEYHQKTRQKARIMQAALRQNLGRVVQRVPAVARSMAGGGSTGGKTPPYKRMRGVVRGSLPIAIFSFPLDAS
jgi:hypothetical protein